MEENDRNDIYILIEKIWKQEINKREINLDRKIEERMTSEISKILDIINTKMSSIINKAEKERNIIGRETRKEIKKRLIEGNSIEEIKQLGLNITDENLEKLYKQYTDLILLSQGMSVSKLAKKNIERKEEETEDSYKKRVNREIERLNKIIFENNLSEIIQEKREEIEERLQEGQTIEELLADKKLNVCREAIEHIQEKINDEEKRANRVKNKIGKEVKREIKKRLMEGNTIEEIKELGLDITYENLQKLYEQYIDLIFLSQGMLASELAKKNIKREEGETEKSYKERIKIETKRLEVIIFQNNLPETIKLKRKEIEKRLEEGQSIEKIIADRELNVCREAVENIQLKNRNLLLLSQGMWASELADKNIVKEEGETEESYKERVRKERSKLNAIIFRNNLSETIRTKRKEVEKRLQEGQIIEQILADKELDVCREVVEYINKKVKNKKVNSNKAKKIEDIFKQEKSESEIKIISTNKTEKEETNQTKKGQINGTTENVEEEKFDAASQGILYKIKQIKQRYTQMYYNNKSVSNNNLDIQFQDEEIKLIDEKIEKLENLTILPKGQQRKLLELIEQRADKTTDIAQLKMLRKKTGIKTEKESYYSNVVYSKIDRKIQKLEIEKRAKNKSQVSPIIQKICKQLSEGTLDIDLAKKQISEEAKKFEQNSSKTKFTLTEKQLEDKILIQIRQNLVNNALNYRIKNPSQTNSQLLEISKNDKILTMKTIVDNLIINGQFEQAKEICSNYNKIANTTNDYILIKQVTSMVKKVNNSEIGNFILRGLQLDEKIENIDFWKSIVSGVERGRIKLENISLGKNEDGTKEITLEDVWPDSDRKINEK